MKLDRLEENWQALGEQDPLWAILSVPTKRGGGWDLDEFFAVGETEVAEVLDALAEHQVQVETDRALDFGCGVGRLTRALAIRFRQCDGVDLAGSMIERARELNTAPDRIHFHHNETGDLRLFDGGSFDFALSLYVLQHMEPRLMRGYLREFVRVLRPRGVAYFNVPERTVTPEPLPSEAWRASLELAAGAPSFEAGGATSLALSVRNESSVLWPDGQVRVGNHWITRAGERIPGNEGRTPLEGPVAPGEQRHVSLLVTAPIEPGSYELELDLVQEWVGWFAQRGSPTLRMSVQVAPSDRPPQQEHQAPTIEMHTLSRAEVTETIERAGGKVLAAVPRDRCGPAMPSIDYVVGRDADAPRRRRRVPFRRA